MLKSDGPVSLEVHGGTDVQWSPSVDYFRQVFLPALHYFGARASLDLRRRGYYPRGQGSVLLQVIPGPLRPARFQAQAARVQGISHCSNLPEHVAKRQAEAASSALEEAGFQAEVAAEAVATPSTGSGITLWSGWKGGGGLGERGLPAEKVGRRAAEEIITELKSGAAVDVHLADQLIPYLALAGGSLTTREISLHTRTNIWTAGHFLDRRIETMDDGVFRIDGQR
jgi:RNA 3'-terminal phosphate cyclase (ATP)